MPLEHTTERPCEDIVRLWPSASQKESCQQELNRLAPWSWNSQPPELWEINLCYLSHPDYGILLQQPRTLKHCIPQFSRFYFISVKYFQFLLWFLLWPMGYLEAFCLISRYAGIFQIFFYRWFLSWFHCGPKNCDLFCGTKNGLHW